MREESLKSLSGVQLQKMAEDSGRPTESFASNKDLVERALLYLETLYKSKVKPLRVGKGRTREATSCDGVRSVIQEEPQRLTTEFLDLPPNIQIQIFSYLDVISLCRLATCCRSFYALSNDELLWQRKLDRDSKCWDVIDHKSHPTIYREASADLTAKEIYLQCCPECRRHRRESNIKFNIPKLSFYLGFSVPRIVMFGPGLESSTSSLVKNLLWDSRSPVTVKGMFPGQFEGVGSGVCLEFDSGQLNLITLYATTRHEREEAALHGRERQSKLLIDQRDRDSEANVPDESEPFSELSQPVRELCTTVDAFIYIVDATKEEHRVSNGLNEFQAMMKNRWLQPKAPLLVLSCVPNASTKAIPSVAVANTLELCDLSRPWQVRACHVSTLYGFLPGIRWLLQEVMHG